MMLRSLLLSALLLTCAAPCAGREAAGRDGAEAAKWERLTFPGEEFSVEWPDMPWVFATRRKVKGSDRKYERQFHFGAYSDGVVFRLTSFDKPHGHEPLEYFVQLAGRYQGIVGKTSASEVTADGFKGVAFEDDDGPNFGAARVIRAKNHVYVLEAFSRDGRRPGVERFLDSLTLGASPQGRAIEMRNVSSTLAPPAGPGAAEGESLRLERGPAPLDARAADGPFTAREVATRAVIVLKLEPGYTEEARKDHVTGLVRLRAVLSSAGRVTNVQIIKGLPSGLTEKAVHAAHCIQFFPAERDGRRVSQYVTLEYNFNIY
jgi:TonB family protein